MTRRWRRLTDRLAGKTEPQPPWEGIPDHLEVPVRRWLYEVGRIYGLDDPIAVRLQLPSSVLASKDPMHEVATYRDSKNPMIVLEIVDCALACMRQAVDGGPWHHVQSTYQHARYLSGLLREGNSAYDVTESGDALQRRLDDTLQGAYDKAIDAGIPESRAAGDHLRDAFAAAYGLKPNPSLAYSHAIKAVEAVANPLFLPKAPEPTLGTVRAHLDQGRHRYEMVIADKAGAPAGIDSVVELINLLWHGQRDRHAGGPTSAPVTQEAAETAVHTAAVLVHWIGSGKIRKK